MIWLFLTVLAGGATAVALVRLYNQRPDVIAAREEAAEEARLKREEAEKELRRKKAQAERDALRQARRRGEHAAATARLQAAHFEEEAERLKDEESKGGAP